MLRVTKKRVNISLICTTAIISCILIIQLLDRNENEVNELTEEELIDYNSDSELVDEFRMGAGEHGKPVFLENPVEIEKNDRLYTKTGFYVIVSDKISVNRSIPDLRSHECHIRKYSSSLPSVSIIIIFHNEVMSVLKRTLHSIYNRTPHKLIRDIILVNDASTENELYDELKIYVKRNFGDLVKIKNLKQRKGLIVTRMEGARIAKGDILIFFDSHIEVGYNWLPPLIEPIKINKKIATVPIIDDFSPKTFEHFEMNPSRGIFDWNFTFREKRVVLSNTEPFAIPVMLGCAFAIDRKFFLNDLHGYDEKLQIWNGENYELSFKLHLCASGVWKVPCSRIAHSFREINPSRAFKDDYVARNFKRIAEVWLDDYKNILYSRQPRRYAKAKTGDLSEVLKIKKNLNCKPFQYFLDVVATDLVEFYPPLYQVPVFASGVIKLQSNNHNLCLRGTETIQIPLKLEKCNENLIEPMSLQHFSLTFFKQIIQSGTDYCLDAANLSLIDCHFEKGNQYWMYDENTNMIRNNNDDGKFCMTANIESMSVVMEQCDEINVNQKWTFGYTNETAMSEWNDIYGYSNI